LTQCISPKRHLSNDKYKEKTLLYKQKVKGNKKYSSYTLEEYFSQQTNRKILLPQVTPYLRAYLKGEKRFDVEFEKRKKDSLKVFFEKKLNAISNDNTLKENKKLRTTQRTIKKRNKRLSKQQTIIEDGNWTMRVVGKAPAFQDSSVVAQTREQLMLFYQSNGYFEVDIDSDAKIKRRKASVTYSIRENKPFLFSSLEFYTNDLKIQKILNEQLPISKIKVGSNYDSELLTQERERIAIILKDSGYYKLTRDYIFFEVDTSQSYYGAEIKVIVKNNNGKQHQRYKVTDVKFIIDRKLITNQLDTNYKQIHYRHDTKSKVSYKMIDYHTKIHSSDYYSYTNTLNTQNALGDLKSFKFININYSETSDSTLSCRISTSSFPKWAFSSEAGVNVNINQNQNIPGPFFNVKLVNKKLTKGFERLEISGIYGIQSSFSFTSQQAIRVREAGVKTSLIFPTFLLQDIVFSKKTRRKMSNWNPNTIFSAGLSDIARAEYKRTNFNLTGSYIWHKTDQKNYNFTPVDLNIINTQDLTANFQNYLEQISVNNGVNLSQSFIPSFVSSIHHTYIFNNNDVTKNKRAYFLKVLSESGGTVETAKQLYKKVSQNTPLTENTRPERLNLPYYQFLKLNLDFRFYQPTSRLTTLSFRLNSGVARGIGPWQVLPYDKYFFAGGINSIRAWNPRRLGPGSYKQVDNNGKITYRFEQPGELLLESSLEWRQKIFSFVNWAFFIDAGNTWTIRDDQNRPGAQFDLNQFYREIALGTGVGLRLDFSFLIFRFDVGFKVWDPARQIIVPFKDPTQRVYNIGIGYPF